MRDHFDVAVIGAGAAGIAALRALSAAGVSAVALESRGRVGGRAHTRARPAGPAAGPRLRLAALGRRQSAGPPHRGGRLHHRPHPPGLGDAGRQPGLPAGGPARRSAPPTPLSRHRLEAAASTGVDRAGGELFEPGGRWNALIDAVSSYYNGAEYDRVSVLDYAAYDDTEVNWRVGDGYGAAIASFAPLDQVVTDCEVRRIDHGGPRLRLETARGILYAEAAIVAVPTPALAEGRLAFSPDLPDVRAAAEGLPLGLADKVFLGLDGPEALPLDGHLFGHTDRTETASYHLRPFGRPYVEVFLGGRCAATLEGEGPGALTAFACEELVDLMGSDIRRRLTPLGETGWKSDPFSRGAYSHALPGCAGARAELARPIDDRLFFAGEATSPNSYSTAHGAWESGERAAAEVLAVLGLRRRASSTG